MRLLPVYLHVGIVLIAQTRTAPLVVGRFKIEVTTAAATVESDTGANVNGEGEIPGQGLKERLVQRRALAFVLSVCVSQNVCVQDRAGIRFRFERLHLGFYGRDTVFVLSLDFFHLGLQSSNITRVRVLGVNRCSD